MKDIYTVIITKVHGPNLHGVDELSTVSFLNYEDAVEYCLEELRNDDDDITEEDIPEIRDELSNQQFLSWFGDKYYIEEAKLVD